MNPFALIFPIAIGMLGFYFAGSALRDIIAGLASRRWPTTQARILSSGFSAGTRYSGETGVDIKYEYMVANRRYESRRYAFSGRGTGKGYIEIGSQFQVGDLVPVHVHPKRPQFVCIHPGVGA